MATLDETMSGSPTLKVSDIIGPEPVAEQDALDAANKQSDEFTSRSGPVMSAARAAIDAATTPAISAILPEKAGEAYTNFVRSPLKPVTWMLHNASLEPLVKMGQEYLANQQGAAGTVGKIAQGATEGIDHVIDSFTTPQNLALLGLGMVGAVPATIQKLAAAGFAVQMATEQPGLFKELKDSIASGDVRRISSSITANLANLAATGLSAKHAIAKAPISQPQIPQPPKLNDVQDQSRIQGSEPNQTQGEASQLRGVQEPSAGQEPNPGSGILQKPEEVGAFPGVPPQQGTPRSFYDPNRGNPPPIPIEQKLVGRYVNTVGGEPGQIVKASPETFTLKVGNNLYDLPYDNHTPQSLLEGSYSYEAEANPAKGGVAGQQPGESPYAFLTRQAQENRAETTPKTSEFANVPSPGQRGRTMPQGAFRRVAAEVYPVPGQQPGESANAFLSRQAGEARAETIPKQSAFAGVTPPGGRGRQLISETANGLKKKSKRRR